MLARPIPEGLFTTNTTLSLNGRATTRSSFLRVIILNLSLGELVLPPPPTAAGTMSRAREIRMTFMRYLGVRRGQPSLNVAVHNIAGRRKATA